MLVITFSVYGHFVGPKCVMGLDKECIVCIGVVTRECPMIVVQGLVDMIEGEIGITK